MQSLRLLPLLLVFVIFIRSEGIELTLQGNKPFQLDTSFLSAQYQRILTTISPNTVSDSSPLVIIFHSVAQQRKRGIFLPEWGGGGALGKDTIIISTDRPSAFYRTDLQLILLHEMVHIALARSWGTLRLPRWFHEGMAMTLSGELQFDEQIHLSRAILTRSLVSLDSMEYLNRFSHRRAQIAYSQCHFAVRFLLNTYGYDMLPELLYASRRTRSFDTACRNVFGLTHEELEGLLWREMVTQYRFLFLLSDYSLFWIGVLALAVVAFIVTRLRNREKKHRLEQEEFQEESDQ